MVIGSCFVSGNAYTNELSIEEPPPKRALSIAEALNSARRSGESWDLEIDLGVRVLPEFFGLLGWELGDLKYKPDHWVHFKIRGGYLLLDEPWYVSTGVSVDYGCLGEWGLGAYMTITNIYDGYWGSFETSWDFKRGLKFSTAAGFGIVGMEWQTTVHPAGHAVLAVVRVPIGLITFVKSRW